MSFFEYNRGTIHSLPYPATSDIADEKNVFLIYAEDMEQAKEAAKAHLEGKELVRLESFQLNHQTTYACIENVACL